MNSNFTTPEQSKRLLGLGVPKSSADCYYLCYSDGTVINEIEPDIIPFEGFHKLWENDLPCWSVGRLIEVNRLCNTNKGKWCLYSNADDRSVLEWILDVFTDSTYDFSKLEE